jgi:Domain of unknown function (DUF3787)
MGGDRFMKKKSFKKQSDLLKTAQSAAFADIGKRIPDSRVAIPREQAVLDAKKWVETNEK